MMLVSLDGVGRGITPEKSAVILLSSFYSAALMHACTRNIVPLRSYDALFQAADLLGQFLWPCFVQCSR